MSPDRPRPPFDAWPGYRAVPQLGHAWYGEPGVLVNQASIQHADVAAAVAIHDLIDWVLEHEGDSVRAAGGLAVIHDWRTIRTHDSAARAKFIERMRRRPKGYMRMAIVVVESQNRLLRMAIETANLVAATMTGGRVEVVNTPFEAIARLGARPRPAGARFPGEG